MSVGSEPGDDDPAGKVKPQHHHGHTQNDGSGFSGVPRPVSAHQVGACETDDHPDDYTYDLHVNRPLLLTSRREVPWTNILQYIRSSSIPGRKLASGIINLNERH